jgi:hypothetical protein
LAVVPAKAGTHSPRNFFARWSLPSLSNNTCRGVWVRLKAGTTIKSGTTTKAMLTEAATYDELYRNFRWDIPARFNIATACCDRHADGSAALR